MIEIGKFYTLKRDVATVAYRMSDHYDKENRKSSEMLSSEELEMPFMVLDTHVDKNPEIEDEDFWVLIMSKNKVGWVNVYPDQLRKFITYSR